MNRKLREHSLLSTATFTALLLGGCGQHGETAPPVIQARDSVAQRPVAPKTDAVKSVGAYAEVSIIVLPWTLTVFPDGHGQFGYGSNPWDFAKFPAGTFGFRTLVEQLTVSIGKTENLATCCCAGFRKQGSLVCETSAVDDVQLILGLFDQARAAARPEDLTSIDKLWLTNSPAICQKRSQRTVESFERNKK